MKTTKLLLAVAALSACAKGDKAADSTAVAVSPTESGQMKMGETGGMNVPESVKYDADLDVFFVSNINGNPSQKDGNGFIAVIRADSTSVVRMLAESGKAPAGGGKAVTLNAPKGLAIKGDTLWVADTNWRAFFRHDVKTGEIVEKIQLTEKDPLIHGVTVHDGYLWYCDDVGYICNFKL